eukprot:GDKH01005648.1.p1 GENE.GDKH01005648.1~~GDKH01005648.1.p1  ORF type:complete len:337 (+),score=57.97 GDKH01005648.1:88-1098(+)
MTKMTKKPSPAKKGPKPASSSSAGGGGGGVIKAPTKIMTISSKDVPNKERRQKRVGKVAVEKKRQKSEKRRARRAAEARGETVERQTPRTVENTREADDTHVGQPDEEILGEDVCDEFASFFAGKVTPKIMLTTHKHASTKTFDFLKEFIHVVPNSFYYKRGEYDIKEICQYASNKGFTELMVVQEKHKEVHGIYLCHLPEGPTAYYRLSSLKLGQEIAGGAVCEPDLMPELIMNNFDSRLGRRVGRHFASLFPAKPNFRGRRVVCFHNQRDFIFFRHYRYIFKANGERAGLQEVGPRFTLKLRWLQQGTFNRTQGDFEFIWRPDLQVSRKKFFTC